MSKRFLPYLFIVLYAFAGLQFVRFYVHSTVFYLNMAAYLNGHERLPFQERVLPIVFLKPIYNSAWIMRHAQGSFDTQRGPFYLLSLISFAIAAIYTQKLYRAVSTRGTFAFLVFPIFLYTVIWTYVIHSEANYSYPYDFPSLAFFAAGLYALYRRNYLGLLTVILFGTFNRETTLFLIAFYAIDAATPVTTALKRFDLRLIPWPRLILLCAIWLTIKVTLAHHYAHNDTSESFLRISYNLHRLRPRLLPALLNICGYTLPLVLLFRHRIQSIRFRNYLWILPLWFTVMFCSGVILETRIYGELCSYCAVAIVLMLEAYLPHTNEITPGLSARVRQTIAQTVPS